MLIAGMHVQHSVMRNVRIKQVIPNFYQIYYFHYHIILLAIEKNTLAEKYD